MAMAFLLDSNILFALMVEGRRGHEQAWNRLRAVPKDSVVAVSAVALAEAGDPECTLVAAAHQTEGKGRLGRSWSDVPDGSLLFSFVLRPRLTPARAGLLSREGSPVG